MKRLKEHLILYDAACPMCDLYTKGFQKAGMLDQNGRLPYQEMPANIACMVDRERSVNEIALVHTASGKVYYGVESLLRIIVHSFPVLTPLGQNRMFLKMADKLYKFVSFNRRVIIPAKKEEMKNPALNPSFHLRYRVAFLVITCLFTAYVLHQYSQLLGAILPQSSYARELLICGGQVLWQGFMVRKMSREKALDYLGNMMTVSLAGSLLLCVIMLLGHLFGIEAPGFYLPGFGFTVGLMLLEHIRRTRLLDLYWKLSASWVLYRILVLFMLLLLHYVK